MSGLHTCYIECGSIYNAFNGCIIERPALLVDKFDGCVYGWGNLEIVQSKFERIADAYDKAGTRDLLSNLMLIELSEYSITRDKACYVLRRASEFTATGFIESLCNHLLNNTDPLGWLESQMQLVPIDITAREWR